MPSDYTYTVIQKNDFQLQIFPMYVNRYKLDQTTFRHQILRTTLGGLGSDKGVT